MDALSITTGVVALAGAVYKVSAEVRSIVGALNDAPASLADVADEVQVTQGALRGVEAALEQDPEAITRYAIEDVFATAVKGCRATLACIKKEFELLFGRSDWKSRFLVLWKEDDIGKLLGRLSRKRESILLLAHVLSLRSVQEMRMEIAQNRPALEIAKQDIYNLIPHYPSCRGTILDSLDAETFDSLLGDRDSILSTTEFDFDFELINTKTYRRVLARARAGRAKGQGRALTRQADINDERTQQSDDLIDLAGEPGSRPRSGVQLDNLTYLDLD